MSETRSRKFSKFPVYPVSPDKSCGCGVTSCNKAGKHPAYTFSDIEAGRSVSVPLGWNHGVLTGSRGGVFVVDSDVRPEHDGEALLQKLGPLPPTYTVRTPTGGLHRYYTLPAKPVRNSTSELVAGVDIRGEGGFVIGAGSTHKNGGKYEVVDDREPANPPDWIVAWPGLYARETATVVDDHTPVDLATPEGQRALRLAREYLSDAPPAIEGQNGSGTLFTVCMFLTRKFELPYSMALSILWELWNPRCVPPWSEEEITRTLRRSRTEGTMALGLPPENFGNLLARRAHVVPSPTVPTISAKPARRVRDPHHVYTFTLGALAQEKSKKISLSEAANFLIQDPDWAGVLQFDEFKRRVYAVNPPMRLDLERGELSEEDCVRVEVWFDVARGLKLPPASAGRLLTTVAKELTFHPVREWLASLPAVDWPERLLPGLAKRLFGNDKPLSDTLLRRWLMSAYRRVHEPGMRIEGMLILQGDEAAGKSTTVGALFGREWLAEQIPDITSKDASQVLMGSWCAEFSELSSLNKTESNVRKDFLTRNVDEFRPPYGRSVIKAPRECVFFGNTNDLQFLSHEEKNRRYWPIQIPTGHYIDTRWLHENRVRIWAEIKECALSAEPHWIEPNSPEAEQLAALHEHFHTEADPWEEAVQEYCTGRHWVRVPDLIRLRLTSEGDMTRVTGRESKRVGGILRRLGAEPQVTRQGSRTVRGWKVPDALAKSLPTPAEARRRAQEVIPSGQDGHPAGG